MGFKEEHFSWTFFSDVPNHSNCKISSIPDPPNRFKSGHAFDFLLLPVLSYEQMRIIFSHPSPAIDNLTFDDCVKCIIFHCPCGVLIKTANWSKVNCLLLLGILCNVKGWEGWIWEYSIVPVCAKTLLSFNAFCSDLQVLQARVMSSFPAFSITIHGYLDRHDSIVFLFTLAPEWMPLSNSIRSTNSLTTAFAMYTAGLTHMHTSSLTICNATVCDMVRDTFM